ncbi:MAG: NADPH-dependent 7-cyano-7-deazaguanine reductase [Lentisphaerae bacterium ADurb.Bin242]|nr:MAG: NADPH-dependent 7-cyano-7-deazaguanine reductase [Lentisphaerae bacterium ADurb.Bin242]
MVKYFSRICFANLHYNVILWEKYGMPNGKGIPMTQKKKSPASAEPHASLTLLNRSHTEYPDSPGKARIETFSNAYPERNYVITFDCPEFTSLCPVTNQPDFGHIVIRYVADRLCLESKALKLYLFSFRNHHSFHEEAVNRILTDLRKACSPRWMEVTGDFMPRGGIAIHVCAEEGDSSLKK